MYHPIARPVNADGSGHPGGPNRLTFSFGVAHAGPAFDARYGTTARRRALMDRLRGSLGDLRRAGWSRVYVGGSFVSGKRTPGDVDLLVPRQPGVDWAQLVRVARRERSHALHFYGAREIVTNALEKEITPAQRRAWTLRKPDFVQFFSQNRAGREVGMAVVDLRAPLTAAP